jgi:hypothetical protein
MVEIDRNDMVVLDRADCIRRLGRSGVGRIALVVDGEPTIFPVNYAVKGDDIYFLTAPGSKLAAAAEGAVLAFEVDHEDTMEHAGWSVLVIGPSSVVPSAEVVPLWELKLSRWVGGGPEIQVRIRSERVSGREIGKLWRASRPLDHHAKTEPSSTPEVKRQPEHPGLSAGRSDTYQG